MTPMADTDLAELRAAVNQATARECDRRAAAALGGLPDAVPPEQADAPARS